MNHTDDPSAPSPQNNRLPTLWRAASVHHLRRVLRSNDASEARLSDLVAFLSRPEFAELLHDVRVSDMVAHRSPIPTATPPAKPAGKQRRRGAKEVLALETSIVECLQRSAPRPVRTATLLAVIVRQHGFVTTAVITYVLRRMLQMNKVNKHPTQRGLWLYRAQGAAPSVLVHKASPVRH